MRVAVLYNTTFSSLDPVSLAAFWAQALGYSTKEASHSLVRLRPPPDASGAPDLLFLKVNTRTQPGGAIHFDLAAPSVDDEVRRLVGLGASLVDGSDITQPEFREANGIKWVVLTDPEGNEFCVGGLPTDPP